MSIQIDDLQNTKKSVQYSKSINACVFISEVSCDSNVDSEEEFDHESTGFTDGNQSWLKPVTRKKGKQLLESDGEENHSHSEASVEGEGDQSDQEQMTLDEDEDYKVRN